MSENFEELEPWITDMIESFSPKERAATLRKLRVPLRRGTQKRITAQTGPDGKKWAGRRDGSRRKMMKGLKLARNLKVTSSTAHLSLGWSGRTGGIARVHHMGLRDRVTEKGVRVKYASRHLLGLSQDDQDTVAKVLEDMVAGET